MGSGAFPLNPFITGLFKTTRFEKRIQYAWLCTAIPIKFTNSYQYEQKIFSPVSFYVPSLQYVVSLIFYYQNFDHFRMKRKEKKMTCGRPGHNVIWT